MLVSLDIRDIALIDRAELSLAPGLNVLTGETGAGKSILLDALGFVLGWRGRAEMVRAGAGDGEVVAVFSLGPDHPARAVLAEAGLPDGDELILRRTNSADGRKVAFVNDRRASGEVLRMLSDSLVELHGQQDDRGLLNPRGHRQLLDEFAAAAPLVAGTRAAWTGVAAARKALAAAESALAAERAEEDFLRHAAAELDRLDPQPGEDAALDARRRAMQGAARIGEDIARAHQALGPDGAEGPMIDALRWLEGALSEAEGRLDPAVAALERALDELGQAEQAVSAALEAMQFDPMELERTEERLFAIRGLARKHAVSPEDLPDLAQGFRHRLAALDGGARNLKDLAQAVVQAEAAYDAAATALTAARQAAAKRLDRAMAAELAPLKMERAVFTTALTMADPGPEGRDEVTFTVATNPGAPAGPLNRIASGGELSRFLLALKVCLTARAEGLTMIFDEIDRGVGGATADAVGRRLEALARGGQVLVVTHSPQVAARGAHHWRVEKRVAKGTTLTRVSELDPGERIEEIGRMLSGDTVTEAARAAARELIGQP
jgi:DNA repair protein RecN (Recombination protein N)